MADNIVMENIKQKLKAHLLEKSAWIYEGLSQSRSELRNVYTKLLITQQAEQHGCLSHESLHHFLHHDKESPDLTPDYQEITSLDIFKPGQNISLQEPLKTKTIKRVVTKGIAGIGKTFAIQNFSLNWAEGKSNQHIELMFVLPFRELNMIKEGTYSLLQLLLHFYPELNHLKDAGQLNSVQVLFIFDGLDESRFPLDFDRCRKMNDVHQKSKVEVLLINLIKGNLLPNALLWVTSRPAAVSQIPSSYIDRMTEVQGFTDQEKENYFRKRFSNAAQAQEVLTCLSGMIGFYFMGHIPVFCWIVAEVFRTGWSDQRCRRITTMTELYIHYLFTQMQRTTHKYLTQSSETKAEKNPSKTQNAAMLLNLSKLAFEQLQKGNIIFYEEDLRECGIDVGEASLFCGFCSEILKEECGLYQKKMFSFVHLSFQEFLAALYVFHCCEKRTKKNISALKSFLGIDSTDMSLMDLQKKVVDKALESEKGQLDLFLRFFLGLSVRSNQVMLEEVFPQTKSKSDTTEEMREYLRKFHAGNLPAERCMNLLLCKFELKQDRFQDDIRMYLNSGVILSPIDCSVVATLLQVSGEVVQELDLSKCFTPFPGREKLMLQIKHCKKAVLDSEHTTDDKILQILLSILQSAESFLRELSLVGLTGDSCPDHILFTVLGGPTCKLETLRLSGLSLDFRKCHALASVLQAKQSNLTALDLSSCIYNYGKDYSGYSEELKENKKYEDINDELTLLTVIPTGLIGPLSKIKEFSMTGCLLRSKCCQVFASVLSSNTHLRMLDLSRNQLQDVGVQLLSVGLGSSKCQLETLRLSCCGVTEEGCASLASALKSNPFHLRELDLSYNHPGESGVKLLFERLEDPNCRLEKLCVDHNEEHWATPKLLEKYACDLKFDFNTVNEHLLLSECNRKVSSTQQKQPYPDCPERFDEFPQVLCRDGLTGRCYWEVEWTGDVTVAVTYKKMKRKGLESDIQSCDDTWCFTNISTYGFWFWHGRPRVFIPIPYIDIHAFLTKPKRLGVFLDWPAGILSVYWLSGDTQTLLHTFHSTFTEPVYPAFIIYGESDLTLLTVTMETDAQQARSSFTPEVSREGVGVLYSFRFPGSGLFQCSLTGLVFKVTHEGQVTYRSLIWDETLLQPARKLPGGPLFSIECPQDCIGELHLPHCEPEPALVSQCLSVVHITDDGMHIVQPLDITDTHVVVDVLHLSSFGIVWDLINRFTNFMSQPILGQTLLFLRCISSQRYILSVILLPGNVPLQDVKDQHSNSEFIQAPSFCHLHKDQTYSLQTEPATFNIQPKMTPFFGNYGPNYHATFEIMMQKNTEKLTVIVQDHERTVWEYTIYLPVSPSPSPQGQTRLCLGSNEAAVEKLQNIRVKFIEKVSDPVLDKLLDELQHCRVMTDAEAEASRARNRADKARDVIDLVRKKGAVASSKMISILTANDPHLCKEIRLT
ncbi:NACHT, LRR and PYD domains-containing protein 12-like isoform X1 [Cololabis saira]|uniref:NACHT, LRR and PYD domains-containing protein 12-like isoform X1 n=2 Tax=Cololabis saira TaxID=129043 RepID=UPI002AD2E31E|nr:NACHT, LRR and PYD domains-containing protein 12-like isoform X1 [Cololabis saira]